jgi:prepilin-type N-terminal cleavage/methylation domain-containing protein
MMLISRKGFTLVETLVAITVMTLAVLAPFAAMQQVVTAARLAKGNLIAASLAQEALEYVRFIRDNNYLAAYASGADDYRSHLLDGLTNCMNPDKCTIDTTVEPPVAMPCGSGDCSPLKINANGLYTQRTGTGYTPTIYTRSFSLIQHTGYETATVTITWEDHGKQTMTLQEDFYDWF